MFRGEQVLIRPIEVEDVPILHKWMNDPDLLDYVWAGVLHPIPLEKMEQLFYEELADSSQKGFLICDLKTEQPIGKVEVTGMMQRDQRGSLTIILGEKEFWGEGYGTEAMILFLNYCFRILNLRRIALEVYEYNQRAIRAYEKVGFQKEGRVRRSVFKNGKYIDEYVMAVLQDEFYEKWSSLR